MTDLGAILYAAKYSTQPAIEMVLVALYSGGAGRGGGRRCEADYTPPPNAEVKNSWRCASSLRYASTSTSLKSIIIIIIIIIGAPAENRNEYIHKTI
jgi:hypothetical protein